ncbi:hypothetical protein OG203_02710 [Nocardia sp. NBC_01499]|uniref:hypothetical protein n=1 Tax=Nocardia sp. NBC_01499 TaxID=2903597 RepID=UPI0038679225
MSIADSRSAARFVRRATGVDQACGSTSFDGHRGRDVLTVVSLSKLTIIGGNATAHEIPLFETGGGGQVSGCMRCGSGEFEWGGA